MNSAAFQIDKQTFLNALAEVRGIVEGPELGELGYLRFYVRGYNSVFWRSLPDGGYTLYVTQGGIRNRDIPRLEKDCLKGIFSRAFGESFYGTVQVETVAGKIVEITGNKQR